MKHVIFCAALLLAVGACERSDVMAEIERAEKEDAQAVADAATIAQRFLDEARARDGVEAKPSGLLVEVTRRGPDQSLPSPGADAVVLVHYEGKLPNGETFDSSIARGEPAQFPLNQVVPGFSEAIQGMRPGDEIIAYFPPELGYGERGMPPAIPPNSALQFRIQLLAFQGSDGRIVQVPRG